MQSVCFTAGGRGGCGSFEVPVSGCAGTRRTNGDQIGAIRVFANGRKDAAVAWADRDGHGGRGGIGRKSIVAGAHFPAATPSATPKDA